MSEEKKYVPFFGCMISVKYPQFEAAVRKTMPKVGMTLVDLDGFTCCPDPIYFKSSDKLTWLTIAARNLCLAEEAGLDVITMCSGCTATLSETRYHLTRDEELREKVNRRLKKIGKEYRGTVSVRHIVTVLRDDIGIDKVAASVVKPLEDLRVAVHYGCHLLKPSEIMRVDDPDRPTILENLIEAIGAEPVHHEDHLLCCGKACMDPEMPAQMTHDVLSSIKKSGVDCMGLICPTCFDAYDLGQIKLARQFKTRFDVPVIYYFQLLGLAQGLSPEDVGLHMHKIMPETMLAKVA
ncbi:MAG: CoB--CoM heterodisulfide reductase iron-sulfur subunit B family protein [bacterium]